MKKQQLPLKTIRKYTIYLLLFVLVPALAIYHQVILPTKENNSYKAFLSSYIATIEKDFHELSESFNSAQLENTEALQGAQAELARIDMLIARSADNLANLRQALGSPPPKYQILIKTQDNQASALSYDTERMINQSEQVLADYKQLIKFLQTYSGLRLKLEEKMAAINAIQNLDVLAGTMQDHQATAAEIKQYADQLDATEVPEDFKVFKTEILATFKLASDGFGMIANVLTNPDSSKLDAAVRIIENAAAKSSITDDKNYQQAMSESVTLKNINELPDKTELLKQHTGQQ